MQATSDPVVTADASEEKPTGSGELDAQTARREAQAILAAVARARNLAVTDDVKVDVIDKEGIRAFSQKSMYEEISPEQLQMLGRIESSLGVLPVGADPEAVILDLLEDGVLGLYDPKSKTLFIGDFVPAFMLSMVVGHEIAHGLQDMHFDLQRLKKPFLHQSDRESAITFMTEGEAQAAYLAWVSGETGLAGIAEPVLSAMGDQALELAGAASPYPILARSLQMPYADGTATIIRLVNARGWEAVDALYDDLPRTSEQMLHLDKLLAREPARAVEVDHTRLESVLGLQRIWHDELGEASLLCMLAEVEPTLVARKAAAGWGGDQLVAFDREGDPLPAPVVVAAVVWDSEQDAKEFEAAFARYLDEVVQEGTFIARRDDLVVFGTRLPAQLDPQAVLEASLAATSLPRSTKPTKPAKSTKSATSSSSRGAAQR